MDNFGGGNWSMIPNIPSQSNPATPSSQDNLFIQQQQQLFNQPQFQVQQPRFQQQQPQQQQPQLQQQNQSFASHLNLLHLVENLASLTESGSKDQQSDAVVGELKSQFEKCQQLLNFIGGTIKAKPATVEGQKHKLEDTEKLLAERRDLLSGYKKSLEEFISSQK